MGFHRSTTFRRKICGYLLPLSCASDDTCISQNLQRSWITLGKNREPKILGQVLSCLFYPNSSLIAFSGCRFKLVLYIDVFSWSSTTALRLLLYVYRISVSVQTIERTANVHILACGRHTCNRCGR